MRFKQSTWLTALAVVGGIALAIVGVARAIDGVALAQEALGIAPSGQGRIVARDPRATTGVPVLTQIPYMQDMFAFQSADGGHDEPLAELVQLDGGLAQESQKLIDQYAAASDDADRAKLKDQLAQTLERQFDAQQKLRELEVSRIEARVKKLHELIDKRNTAKRTIIDKRIDQLIRDAEGLGWSTPGGGGGAGAGPVMQYQRLYSPYPGTSVPIAVPAAGKQAR